jgi:NUMOD4 motif/HNH endonuclease
MQQREWRTIPGFSRYQVSDDGRVRRPRRFHNMPAGRVTRRKDSHGYLACSLTDDARRQRKRQVHTLVAAAFIGPRPPARLVRHLDGYRFNNRVGNLAYGTALENAQDAQRHGTTVKGERHGSAVLSEAAVRSIHARCMTGEKQAAVAASAGVSQGAVATIMAGKNWRHLQLPRGPSRKIPESVLSSARQMLAEGSSLRGASRALGCTHTGLRVALKREFRQAKAARRDWRGVAA